MLKIPVIDILKEKNNKLTWFNTYILVDLDNVSWDELGTFELFDEHTYIAIYADKDHVKMFDNDRFKNVTQNTSAYVEAIKTPTGKNATDFFIVCDMAKALANIDTLKVYIISNDKGYDCVIKHMQDVYDDELQAIERFTSTAKCVKDYMFFNSENKQDVKENIHALISGEYRKSAIEDVLSILEK